MNKYTTTKVAEIAGEVWKDLEELKGLYQVSNYARVRNTQTNGIIKPTLQKRGYYYVTLQILGHAKCFRLNRLIASAFVEKPKTETKLEVNHIDGNKANNFPSNLQWVTRSENMWYSYNVLHRNRSISEATRAKISHTLKVYFAQKKKREQSLFDAS